jgi:hypothetical protein
MLIEAIEAFVASWNQNAATLRMDQGRGTPAANETLLL